MEKHLTVVAALHIGYGALGILAALIVFVAVVGGGVLSGDDEAIAITSFVGTFVALLIIILSCPAIIAGVALLKRYPWARILGFVVAVLDLFNIPIGTALGIYTIWTLMHEDVEKMFRSEPSAGAAPAHSVQETS